ncbi:PREDICTED: uncharacterized protein LOC108374444, partial [Rhagoletis zephyria]|uniref:uncharacterized protein LOC108374444 n=1 Tax=Rhagoletis zephyria TaxID=28612 RepID=UPI0008116293
SASVVVHVINGEHPAAMQHGNSSANRLSSTLHGMLYRIAQRTLTTLAASVTTATTTAAVARSSEQLLPPATNELEPHTAWPLVLLRRLLDRVLLAAATTNWCIVAMGWLLSQWALQCGQWQHQQQQRHRLRQPLEDFCWCWWHWRRWSGGTSLPR